MNGKVSTTYWVAWGMRVLFIAPPFLVILSKPMINQLQFFTNLYSCINFTFAKKKTSI